MPAGFMFTQDRGQEVLFKDEVAAGWSAGMF